MVVNGPSLEHLQEFRVTRPFVPGTLNPEQQNDERLRALGTSKKFQEGNQSPAPTAASHERRQQRDSSAMHSPLSAARLKRMREKEAKDKEKEFRVFALSAYNHDGWEPFLPPNPLAGTPNEQFCNEFEARRRKLDNSRESSTLKAEVDEDLKRILSKRTARRLAKEGIAADTTNMGALSKGIELIDEEGVMYHAPMDFVPSQDQMKKYLRAEAKRMWSQDGRLDAMVKKLVQQRQEEAMDPDKYEHFEEEDYQSALKMLAKLKALPRVITGVITLMGSGAAHFIAADPDIQKRAIRIFKKSLSECLGLTIAEIGINSVVDKTVGTLSESVDVDFQISTSHSEMADMLADLVEECIESGSLGHNLTMLGLQALTSIRKGPVIFTYARDVDRTQRSIGEAFGDLQKQMARWEYELGQAKKKTQRDKSEESLQVEAEAGPGAGGGAEAGPERLLSVASVTSATETARSPVPTRRKGNLKKVFEEDHRGELRVKESTQQSAGPHGFTLKERPSTALDRVLEYSAEQKLHVFDLAPKRAKSSMGKLATLNPIEGSGGDRFSVAMVLPEGSRSSLSHQGSVSSVLSQRMSIAERSQIRTTQDADSVEVPPETKHNLAHYFRRAVRIKNNPQKGYASEKTMLLQDIDREQQEVLERLAELEALRLAQREETRQREAVESWGNLETDDMLKEMLRQQAEDESYKRRSSVSAAQPLSPSALDEAKLEPMLGNIDDAIMRAKAKAEEREAERLEAEDEIARSSSSFRRASSRNLTRAPSELSKRGPGPLSRIGSQAGPSRVGSLAGRAASALSKSGGSGGSVGGDEGPQAEGAPSGGVSAMSVSGEAKVPRAGATGGKGKKGGPTRIKAGGSKGKKGKSKQLEEGWTETLDELLPENSAAKSKLRKRGAKGKRRSVLSDFDPEDATRSMKGLSKHSTFTLISREGSVINCKVCSNNRRILISEAPPKLIDILDKSSLEGRYDIDCPYCGGIKLQYRKPMVKIRSAARAMQMQEGHKSKAKQIIAKPNKEVLVTPLVDPQSGSKHVVGSWVDSKNAVVILCYATGFIEERDISTGNELSKMQINIKGQVYSFVRIRNCLYLGMENEIQEVELVPTLRMSRVLRGQKGKILCMCASGDNSCLISGSHAQSTFVWSLETGKVLNHRSDWASQLPDSIKHFADDLPSINQAMAFRHHTAPVSCVTPARVAFVTGSWDGCICVAHVQAYKEKMLDEKIHSMLTGKRKDLRRAIKTIVEDFNANKSNRKGARVQLQMEKDIEKIEDQLGAVNQVLQQKDFRLRGATGRCRRFLTPERDVGRVTSIVYARLEATGAYGLFAGYSDGNVRQWDVASGNVVCVFMCWDTKGLSDLCLGSGRLYTAYENGLIKVWSLSAIKENTTRTHNNTFDVIGHVDSVKGLALCDNLLVSTSDDGTMRVLDLTSFDPEMKMPEFPAELTEAYTVNNRCRAMAVDSTGKVYNRHLMLWPGGVQPGSPMPRLPSKGSKGAKSPIPQPKFDGREDGWRSEEDTQIYEDKSLEFDGLQEDSQDSLSKEDSFDSLGSPSREDDLDELDDEEAEMRRHPHSELLEQSRILAQFCDASHAGTNMANAFVARHKERVITRVPIGRETKGARNMI